MGDNLPPKIQRCQLAAGLRHLSATGGVCGLLAASGEHCRRPTMGEKLSGFMARLSGEKLAEPKLFADGSPSQSAGHLEASRVISLEGKWPTFWANFLGQI